MGKRTTSPKSGPMIPFDIMMSAMDDEVAEDDARHLRMQKGLPGPPTDYEVKLLAAFNHLTSSARLGKFRAFNEEDVQCFLYHALVLQFGDATRIRTKRRIGTPAVKVGANVVGGMIFPDLVIGESDDDPNAIYIELKVRAQGAKSIFPHCLADLRKLASNHDLHRQFLILFDCHIDNVFLSGEEAEQLHQAAGKQCSFLHYPEKFNERPGKAAAAKALATMRKNGIDLSAQAKLASLKARHTIKSRAKQAISAQVQQLQGTIGAPDSAQQLDDLRAPPFCDEPENRC